MTRMAAWLGQAALYALFAAALGIFSRWPPYRVLPAGQALVKVSFIHHGQRVEACRRWTAEELAKLAPNMRSPMKCGRERAPVTIEVDLDGTPLLRHAAPPSGLSRDGASSTYHRFAVIAGVHRIAVRFDDAGKPGAFTHTREATVTLAPSQVLVIDFDPEHGGITLS